MTREIKFRAWDVKDKCWVGHNIHIDGSGCLSWAFGYSCNPISRDEFVVEQFTGLKDQKGKEVFEGDIIKCGLYGQTVAPIEFIPCGFGFVCPSDKKFTPIPIYHPLYSFPIEVIGNIHENGDLLK